MTIDASEASGNPLGQSSGLALAGSLTPSGPFGAGGLGSVDFSSGSVGDADPESMSRSNSAAGGNPSPVPEPSTLALLLFALSSVIGQRIAVRRRARWNESR